MRPIIRMFVLAAVSASATAAFAFDRVTVNVPFNFETHGKTFPAGIYKVESAANHYALTLSNKTDTKTSFTRHGCHRLRCRILTRALTYWVQILQEKRST